MSGILQITDGDDMEHELDQVDIIILEFSRANVEACLIGDALDRLLILSDSEAHTRQFTQSVIFTFEGFGDDPRELCEIPEVRAFMKVLSGEWAYWGHFLAPLTDVIALLYTLLLTPQRVMTAPGQVGFSVDMVEHAELTEHLSRAAAMLHAQYRFPEVISGAIQLRFQGIAKSIAS
jgi:hypothetical protein